MREKEREESKENMKNTREKNNKTQKRNNVNSSSSYNACPLSITIKVSNTNGWEYR